MGITEVSRSPNTVSATVRGNGRGRHHQIMRIDAQFAYTCPLIHAEAMLLVDNDQAESGELRRPARVPDANHQIHVAVGNGCQLLPAFFG